MKKFVLAMLVALTALGMVLPINAEVQRNFKEPIEWLTWNECANDGAGENIYFTGQIHYVYAETVDGAGGYHVKLHQNVKGSGTGDVTGDKYQLNAVLNQELNAAADSMPYEITITEKVGLIGQGKDNNMVLKWDEHITVNANGEVTVENDNYRIDCK